eukprot:94864-Amphidinium_carterae.1
MGSRAVAKYNCRNKRLACFRTPHHIPKPKQKPYYTQVSAKQLVSMGFGSRKPRHPKLDPAKPKHVQHSTEEYQTIAQRSKKYASTSKHHKHQQHRQSTKWYFGVGVGSHGTRDGS